jgi:hypothetical protein
MKYVKTISVDTNISVSAQLANRKRGQWVYVNGLTGRILNRVGSRVVIWLQKEKTAVVFAH